MTSLPSNEQSAWFALSVKPRHEKAVAVELSWLGLASYLPLYNAVRQWSDRRKIVPMCLFPGYVFCKFSDERRLDALQPPGVISIVGFGDGPAPIPQSEIDAIRTILSSGRPAAPWPFLRVGVRVRIERGALAGVEGIMVREKDTFRVVVNVGLLQRSVAVEIDRTMIRPARS